MSSKKARINRGKHIIVSTDVHSRLKVLCTKAGVQVTSVADEALMGLVKDWEQADAVGGTEARDHMLVEMAARSLARNPPTVKPKAVPPVEPAPVAMPMEPKVEEPKGADAPVEQPTRTD
jgi:hypothetical protein